MVCSAVSTQEAVKQERSVGENTGCSRVFFPTCRVLYLYLSTLQQNIAQSRLLYLLCDKECTNFSILGTIENRSWVEYQNHKHIIPTPSSHIIKRDGVVMSVIALNILQAHLEVCRCNALIK